ncbi:MAG: hypothetical protein ACT4OK_15475 [Gemmobacter sp.]
MTTPLRPDPFLAAMRGRDPGPAAAVLRQMALATLAEVLGAPPPAAMSATPLADWFGETPVQGAAVRRSLHLLQRAMLFGQVGEGAPVARALVAGALPAGRVAPLRDRLARLVGAGRRGLAPPGIDAFGPALAAHAFADAAFRRSVVAQVRTHLAARVLFHPDESPVPVLSPACGLMLAAARTRATDRTPVTQGLRRLAETLAATGGWAGFWDQWLLGQAAGLPALWLPRAILTLPLLARGSDAISDPETEIDPRIGPDWQKHAPAYCHRLLAGLP